MLFKDENCVPLYLARKKGEMCLEEVGRKQNAEPFFLDLNNKLGTPLLHSGTDEEGDLCLVGISQNFGQ